MIPDGWKIELLGEFMIVKDGVHQTPTYTASGIPFLRVTDIQDESINLSKTKYISKEEHDKITARLKPTNGDILYSKNGTIGITRIVDWDWEFSFFVSLALLRFKKDGYSVQYLAQYLQSDLAKREIYQGSKQGSVINLHLEEIQKFRVPIPPFLEQCKIAEVLGVWDELIDLLERLIGKMRSRKQGLMQQLLTGKKRFKEFEGSEWKTVNLSDLCSLITKGTTPSSIGFEFCNEGINYIKIESINDRGQFLTEKIAKISEEAYQALKRSQLKELDILFSIAGALGRVAIVSDNILPANTNQALAIIRLKEEYRNCHEYLFQYLKSDVITKHIECVNVQAAQANLSLSQINNFKIIFPSLPEQEKIAAVLSAADEEISTLEKQLAAYKQQKLGLMQQLLTGRIRI
jgi:type I restriction enzyme, S subunit